MSDESNGEPQDERCDDEGIVQAGGEARGQAASRGTAAVTMFRPLRIWPAVVLLGCMALTRSLPSLLENGPAGIWMSAAFGPLLAGLLLLPWWLISSRATWRERVGGLLGIGLMGGVTVALVDPTMRGPAIMVLTIPLGLAAFAVGAILWAKVLSSRRTVIALTLAMLGFGYSLLLRSDGMWGNFGLGLHWRWVPSAEDELLASKVRLEGETPELYSVEQVREWVNNSQWPGFRGADRSGRQRGETFTSDWESSPPREIWRTPVGPGWSSFAVAGNLLFTQEQRGEMECIVCYDTESGREIWAQAIESRFDDPLGGPGPRATPALGDGGLFALGAQGWLTRLDPQSGDVVWQIDLREVADRNPPMWGFCSSPLVIDDVVVVYAGGKGEKGTVAFDLQTGKLRWSVAAGDHSYSSPQVAEIDGKRYVLMLSNMGVDVLDPADGQPMLRYDWQVSGYRSLQPQVVNGDSILLPSGMGRGTRLVKLSTEGDAWSADEVWTTLAFKPDFNDFVIFKNHMFGFDDAIFTCIDLATGERRWKRGRYGKGQVLLLEDSEMLLVAGEKGQLVLLNADPNAHVQVAQIEALDGKTWNHPVVVGDRLYLRNAKEAVCYQMPVINGGE